MTIKQKAAIYFLSTAVKIEFAEVLYSLKKKTINGCM
jgi:hypothetical protein